MAYFETLQRTLRIEFPQLPALRICHGSPRAIKEDIKPQNAVNQEIFEQIEETYIVCGHTHRVTDIEEYGKIVWNPGAVVHSLF